MGGQSVDARGQRLRSGDLTGEPVPVELRAVGGDANRKSGVRIHSGYNGFMEKASVSRLKNGLSAYLRKVRAGQTVVIYDHDVPIARIDRIEDGGAGADRLALLAAQGVTRPPARAVSVKRLFASLSHPLPRSGQLQQALRDERADDR